MQLDVRMREIAERERWTSWVLLLWVAFTLGLGGAVALYARRVLRPLEHITERAKSVASGDLSPQPALLVHDEIGDLSRTFESMVQAIAKANRELLESERLVTIGKMAAHVTHEVRNPLSSIALNLELLEEELPAGTEGRSLHAAITREVARLTELTEQYLSLARPSRPELRHENLAEVVDDALRFVERDLLRAGVHVELSVEPNLPEVSLDEAQMRQVLHNLLRNARQAMPDGGTVFVKVHSAPGAYVAVSIEDEGAGIDAALREHLFEPFFTTKVHGTGLGLSISRHIVEAHGGEIHCEERTPRGTRFVIRMPTVAAAHSA
jgi:signal transduction histidine kinase